MVLVTHRRGSGCANWFLSMPSAIDVLIDSADEESRSAEITGDNGTSLMSAVVPNVASLAWKAADVALCDVIREY